MRPAQYTKFNHRISATVSQPETCGERGTRASAFSKGAGAQENACFLFTWAGICK